MGNDVRSFCKRLNLDYNDELIPHFNRGKELYRQKGLFAVNKERILAFHNRYNIFRTWLDDVLAACDELAKDEDLMVYVYALVSVIEAGAQLSVIGSPDRERLDTDFAPLFSILYFLEDMIDEMKKRCCSHSIISDTLYGLDSEINDYYSIFGRSGMRTYINWYLNFVRGDILRIGRFQFQITRLKNKIRVYKKDDDIKVLIDGEYMHKNGMVFGSAGQNDDVGKYFADISVNDDLVSGYACNEYGDCLPNRVHLKGYSEVLRQGDYVLSVHVPSDGPLAYEFCEKSYADAMEIFGKYYSEYKFKAFFCSSWLLEKKLKDIMGKETNITRFAKKYVTFPQLSSAEGVYRFLYGLNGKINPAMLPENSSMHIKMKKYLMGGNIFYEKSGIILF